MKLSKLTKAERRKLSARIGTLKWEISVLRGSVSKRSLECTEDELFRTLMALRYDNRHFLER